MRKNENIKKHIVKKNRSSDIYIWEKNEPDNYYKKLWALTPRYTSTFLRHKYDWYHIRCLSELNKFIIHWLLSVFLLVIYQYLWTDVRRKQ